MNSILKKLGTAAVAILGDRLVSAVSDLVTGSGGGDSTFAQTEAVDAAISSQLLAAVVFKKFGVAGVATVYDAGLISTSDFAMYVVAQYAYREPPMSADRIEQIENAATGEGIITSLFSSGDLSTRTTNPDVVARMYTYLKASE